MLKSKFYFLSLVVLLALVSCTKEIDAIIDDNSVDVVSMEIDTNTVSTSFALSLTKGLFDGGSGILAKGEPAKEVSGVFTMYDHADSPYCHVINYTCNKL